MFAIFTVLIGIIAVLLIGVVLIQNSKGGGLAGEFGGSGATQMFGVQKTTDLLEKITWGLAGAMSILALVSNLFIGSPTTDGVNSINVDKAQSKTIAAPISKPVIPAPQAPVKK